jgi:hypothetical protein
MNLGIIILGVWFAGHIVQITAIVWALLKARSLHQEGELASTLFTAAQCVLVVLVGVMIATSLLRDEPLIAYSYMGKLALESVLALVFISYILLIYFGKRSSLCEAAYLARLMGLLTTAIALLFVEALPV